MSRPLRIAVNAGDNAWDSELNDNNIQLYDRPIPLLLHAGTLASLETARPAAQHDWCLAIVDYNGGTTPGSALAFSDGTAWRLASNWQLLHRATFTSVSTTHNVVAADDVVVTTGASSFAVNLPVSNDASMGRKVRLKHQGTGTITVTPNGADTIDGAATFAVATQNSSFEFISDGAGDWLIF